MHLLRQRGHQCTVTALAMLLDKFPSEIISALGKTGEPDQPIHIQDIQDYLLDMCMCLAEVEYMPCFTFGCLYTVEYAASRFAALIRDRRALIYAQGIVQRHMLAWDGNRLADPATGTYLPLSNYPNIYSAYVIGWL